jgi:hypothetical protein
LEDKEEFIEHTYTSVVEFSRTEKNGLQMSTKFLGEGRRYCIILLAKFMDEDTTSKQQILGGFEAPEVGLYLIGNKFSLEPYMPATEKSKEVPLNKFITVVFNHFNDYTFQLLVDGELYMTGNLQGKTDLSEDTLDIFFQRDSPRPRTAVVPTMAQLARLRIFNREIDTTALATMATLPPRAGPTRTFITL